MYDNELVNLYTRLVEWSTVDADAIDDDKYLFAKKFSEVSEPSLPCAPDSAYSKAR